MSVFSVANSDEFTQALAQVQAGDTIGLQPGAYSGLEVSGLNFAATVNIVSEDAADPAVITGLKIDQSSGLLFHDLKFAGAADAQDIQFLVARSSQIAFEHVSFQNATAADLTAVVTVASNGVSFHNDEDTTLVSTDFFGGDVLSVVSSAPIPFQGVGSWLQVDSGTGFSVTNTIPVDVQQAANLPDPIASVAVPQDFPIQMTGIDHLGRGDLLLSAA